MDEEESRESPRLDEDFVRAARYREPQLRLVVSKPSRASLREVKREARARKRRGRDTARARRLVVRGAAAVAVLAAVSTAGFYALSDESRPRPQVPVAVPSYSPLALPSASPSPADPFRDTQVAAWSVGAAGIAPPKPSQVGRYSPAQVGDAFEQTRRYLRAALLDPRVLYNGDMKPVYDTLSPESARRLSSDNKKDPGRDGLARFANRFRPDVERAHDTVKVDGFMTARQAPDGRLQVDFTYVAVYALRPAAGGYTDLVVIRRTGATQFDRLGRTRITRPWLYQSGYASGHSDCTREWPHPDFLHVYLSSGSPEVDALATSEPGPRPTWDMLDPRAEPPDARCFHNPNELD